MISSPALRAWQQGALESYFRAAARLSPGRHARRGQDHLRAAARRRAARPPRRRGHHRRLPDRAPEAPVGARPRRASASRSTRSSRTPTGRTAKDFVGVAVTYAQVAAHPALHRGAYRGPADAGHPRRGPPRGRRLSWGDAIREAFEPGRAPARADRHAVPHRHQPDPVRHLRGRARTASGAAAPTTPTATARRWPTASSGR